MSLFVFRRAVLALVLLVPLSSFAEERIAASFGDWSKICSPVDSPLGNSEICQLSQTVNQSESGKRLFQTTIGYVPEYDTPVIFMTAPLGMYLPRGITLELTKDTLMSAVVQRCDANGCLAVTPIDPEFLAAMKAGKEARMIFGATAEQNMAVPLSLMGFTDGIASLEKPAAPAAEETQPAESTAP